MECEGSSLQIFVHYGYSMPFTLEDQVPNNATVADVLINLPAQLTIARFPTEESW